VISRTPLPNSGFRDFFYLCHPSSTKRGGGGGAALGTGLGVGGDGTLESGGEGWLKEGFGGIWDFGFFRFGAGWSVKNSGQ